MASLREKVRRRRPRGGELCRLAGQESGEDGGEVSVPMAIIFHCGASFSGMSIQLAWQGQPELP